MIKLLLDRSTGADILTGWLSSYVHTSHLGAEYRNIPGNYRPMDLTIVSVSSVTCHVHVFQMYCIFKYMGIKPITAGNRNQ